MNANQRRNVGPLAGRREPSRSQAQPAQAQPAAQPVIGSNEEASKESSGGEESSFACPDSGFYVDENDCSRFYRCVAGGPQGLTAHQFNCPASLVFDESLGVCNWKAQVPACNNAQSKFFSKNDENHLKTNFTFN